MKLKLYNTLSGKKETFKPINGNNVGMYSCGPTVYNYAHLGNLRTYIFNDILRRTLLKNGFSLTHVMNITDVGHLTSDADDGEDKMVKGARRERKTVWQIADFYTKAFFGDAKKLNILTPEILCKATDHINDMIEINKKIEQNGFAYFSGGNLYFDTSKLEDYGKLARLHLEGQQEGARIKVDQQKKNPTDFALWLTKSKFEDQEMKWDSPWGKGYPGWHIECAAMSIKYLGEQFDIHTGGTDHISLHHTNELAEAEAATGKKPWVKYWLHGEFLILNKEKMAKSGDNFLRLQVLVDKGYDPLVYRYFCLTSHYRSNLQFSFEALDGAKNSYEILKQRIIEMKKNPFSNDVTNEYKEQFYAFVNDDMNMPRALSVFWAVVKDNKFGNKEKYALLLDFDEIMGFGIQDFKEQKVEITVKMKEKIAEREKARKNNDWETADRIRDEFKEIGIELIDTNQGTSWNGV